jgi:hypothetical protein
MCPDATNLIGGAAKPRRGATYQAGASPRCAGREKIEALKGRDIGGRIGIGASPGVPGAMPWAGMFNPFGVFDHGRF